jgi:hypothetical protein
MRHDTSYRLLFSKSRLVRELIDLFGELRVLNVQPATLEQVSGSFVDKRMKRRDSDIIWRGQTNTDDSVYFYFVIEFQSTVDALMPLRVNEYVNALRRDLLGKGHNPVETLIVPIVVYTGDSPWTAPRSLAKMGAAAPRSLKHLIAGGEYLLLDCRRLRARKRNRESVLEAIIWLEHAKDYSQHGEILGDTIRLLKDDADLLLTIRDWLRVHTSEIPEYSSLVEQAFADKGDEMTLSANIKVMREKDRQAGLRAGIRQGMAQGRAAGINEGRAAGINEGRAAGINEGRAAATRQLELLLTKRFGARWQTAKRREALANADLQSLELWFEKALDAQSITEVFGK